MAINAVSSPQVFFSPSTSAARAAVSNEAPASASATASDSVTISTPSGSPAPAPAGNSTGDATGVTPKKWTVMLFSASDNNLYSFMQKDIDEAEQVGCTKDLNVIVQTDHAPKGGHVKRYELKKDNKPGIHSPEKGDLGDGDMGSPKVLSDFIQWGIKNYPAENYMLIISDHGGGWQGACSDDSKNSWMTLPMLEEGLKDAREKSGRKLDVLGFDACLMASAEVAHQLKNEATYLVGSQETEGGAGWQYNRVLSKEMLEAADLAMRTRLDFTPKEMAANVVSMAQGVQHDLATMTAFDTSKIQGVTDAVSNFAKAIVDSPVGTTELSAAKNETQGFYEFYDLHDFAGKVAEKGAADPKLGEAAKAVQTAIGDAVVAEQHSSNYPGAHGITIELNKQYSGYKPGSPSFTAEQNERIDFGSYSNTAFAKETGWLKAVDKING